VVPVEALLLAWALEDRGATFAVDGDDLLVDGPVLTDADLASLRRCKKHLIAIVKYAAPAVGAD
jgi:hypothetical protein